MNIDETTAYVAKLFRTELERVETAAAKNDVGAGRNILIAVALQNLADNFVRGERNSKAYNEVNQQ